jgi:hypothetical protein
MDPIEKLGNEQLRLLAADLMVQLEKGTAYRPVLWMLVQARKRAAGAIDLFIDVDPEDVDAVRKIKAEILVYTDMVRSCRELLAKGREAEARIGEDDRLAIEEDRSGNGEEDRRSSTATTRIRLNGTATAHRPAATEQNPRRNTPSASATTPRQLRILEDDLGRGTETVPPKQDQEDGELMRHRQAQPIQHSPSDDIEARYPPVSVVPNPGRASVQRRYERSGEHLRRSRPGRRGTDGRGNRRPRHG